MIMWHISSTHYYTFQNDNIILGVAVIAKGLSYQKAGVLLRHCGCLLE